MREILFRGKRIDNGEWVEGFYCPVAFGRFPCQPAIIPKEDIDDGYWHPEEVDPSTVGQFTGLYDSTKWSDLTETEKSEWLKEHTEAEWNGKKIFEGDIVRCVYNYSLKEIRGHVVWGNGCFSVQDSISANRPAIDLLYQIEVIGNIHDNSELLDVLCT